MVCCHLYVMYCSMLLFGNNIELRERRCRFKGELNCGIKPVELILVNKLTIKNLLR